MIGVVAYADAVDELRPQLAAAGTTPDWIVVADGSGGTHAGILAGLGDSPTRVVGVDVGTRPDLDDAVPRLAAEAARLSGRPQPTGEIIVDHDHYGDGYGRMTAAGLEAMTLTARTEGLVLDPVYTGKAMAGLIARSRRPHRANRDGALLAHRRRARDLRCALRARLRRRLTTRPSQNANGAGVVPGAFHNTMFRCSAKRRVPCGQRRRRAQRAPGAATASSR